MPQFANRFRVANTYLKEIGGSKEEINVTILNRCGKIIYSLAFIIGISIFTITLTSRRFDKEITLVSQKDLTNSNTTCSLLASISGTKVGFTYIEDPYFETLDSSFDITKLTTTLSNDDLDAWFQCATAKDRPGIPSSHSFMNVSWPKDVMYRNYSGGAIIRNTYGTYYTGDGSSEANFNFEGSSCQCIGGNKGKYFPVSPVQCVKSSQIGFLLFSTSYLYLYL